MLPHADSLDVLRTADEDARAVAGPLRSVRPGGHLATPLVEIGERSLTAAVSPESARAFARALSRIVSAQLKCFPGNVFWDFDYGAARLLDVALAAPGQELDAVVLLVSDLVHAFGKHSPVNFAYVHDLSYGFDWARWVAKDVPERGNIGPLHPAFLTHLRRRGLEIAGLIAKGDSKYPALEGGVHRNPFGFSRTPEDEERLFRDLAERGLLPLEAWRADAAPAWNRDYAALRDERARALGLWKKG
jgi:hypothetical protein